MAPVAEMIDHEVFRVELHGDTLVVIPRGDAVGFNIVSVNVEQARVAQLINSDAVKHLVVDLGHANYLGSIMLGAVLQFGQMVRDRHGRIALAGASNDMEDVMRLMKLDQMWEHFPDVRAALRAIAKIPLGERLWAQRHVAAALLVVVAVVLAIVYFPRPNYGKRYYIEVAKLWREAQARQKTAGEDEWERYVARTEEKLKPMLKHMLRRSDQSRGSTEELLLIYIIRDYWVKALDRRNPQASNYAQMIQQHLRNTEALLEGRTPPWGMSLDP